MTNDSTNSSCGCCFSRLVWIALFSASKLFRFFNADTLRNHPQNTREITLVFDEPRGFIRTADGEVIAHTVAVSRQGRLRQYPYGPLYSHVSGFISERTADRVWNEPRTTSLGKRFRVRLQDNRDLFIDRSATGQLELSIRHDIQLIARAAMAGQVGAAVVFDPATGSVLGSWRLRSSTRTICLRMIWVQLQAITRPCRLTLISPCSIGQNSKVTRLGPCSRSSQLQRQ